MEGSEMRTIGRFVAAGLASGAVVAFLGITGLGASTATAATMVEYGAHAPSATMVEYGAHAPSATAIEYGGPSSNATAIEYGGPSSNATAIEYGARLR
jgi:hypothetical protein